MQRVWLVDSVVPLCANTTGIPCAVQGCEGHCPNSCPQESGGALLFFWRLVLGLPIDDWRTEWQEKHMNICNEMLMVS